MVLSSVPLFLFATEKTAEAGIRYPDVNVYRHACDDSGVHKYCGKWDDLLDTSWMQ